MTTVALTRGAAIRGAAAQPAVLLDRRGPVATVTLNRPASRNALSGEMIAALRDAVAALGAAADLNVVILAARGPVFCAGHDLKELRGLDDPAALHRLFADCALLMQALIALPQPVIAKVQGMATAAGCQLVATCDLAIAAESARFATPGVNIGLFCSTPMVALSRAVPRKRALEMLLTGEAIDAPTAAAWGLINRVVPDGELAVAVDDLAETLAAKPAATVALGKRAFYDQIERPLAQAYPDMAELMARNMLAADAREGIAAFLERRPPEWSDR